MGSLVNFNAPFDHPSYVACVYCSTYRALVAFVDTDVKWFDVLQLRVSYLYVAVMLLPAYIELLAISSAYRI